MSNAFQTNTSSVHRYQAFFVRPVFNVSAFSRFLFLFFSNCVLAFLLQDGPVDCEVVARSSSICSIRRYTQYGIVCNCHKHYVNNAMLSTWMGKTPLRAKNNDENFEHKVYQCTSDEPFI